MKNEIEFTILKKGNNRVLQLFDSSKKINLSVLIEFENETEIEGRR